MSEKTEQPTQKKLRDARKKGDVTRSKDAAKALLALTCFGYLILASAHLIQVMQKLIHWSADHAHLPFHEVLGQALEAGRDALVEASLPLLGIVIAISIVGEMVPSGPLLAFEKLKPSLDKLNVVNNVKNMFSMKNLVEFCKSILKVTALAWVLWLVLRDNLGALARLPPGGIVAVGAAMGDLLRVVLLATILLFILIAAADLLIQYRLFLRQQKMTKDEVKREYKDSEGDPHVKHARKHLHREMLHGETRARVRGSTAVVVNPTHFAVALRYEPGKTPLPLVVAKGEGPTARMIVDEARASGIPIVRNVLLARGLWAEAEVDDYVPDHLLVAVVEVLQAIRNILPDWAE